ncbi:MAG: methionine ABC transporter substrate-binding protein, partial [Anaerorhabdus sp.]
MKKVLKTLLAGLLVLGLAACSSKPASEATPETTEPTTGETTKLVVSATLDPHSKILEFAKPILAEKGVELEIQVL